MEMNTKGRRQRYQEPKDQHFQARLTKSGKDGLQALAERMGMPASEIVERLGRGELHLPPSLGGGIIAQLILHLGDQLGEAVECVEWYQRSVEKYQRQLDNLKQLQRLAEKESEAQK